MKKSELVLLDANIIIELFRLGLWDKIIDRFHISLSRTVAETEVKYFEDSESNRHYIDLNKFIEESLISVFDVPASKVLKFKSEFDPTYVDRLDPGETESLIYLLENEADCVICSADSIVFKILGNLNKEDSGISLDEIFQMAGFTVQVAYQYSKGFRERYSRLGAVDSVTGKGKL